MLNALAVVNGRRGRGTTAPTSFHRAGEGEMWFAMPCWGFNPGLYKSQPFAASLSLFWIPESIVMTKPLAPAGGKTSVSLNRWLFGYNEFGGDYLDSLLTSNKARAVRSPHAHETRRMVG